MKLRNLLFICSVLFFVPLALVQANQWSAGFLRDSGGNLVVTCRTGPTSDAWSGNFKRDINGALDVGGKCVGNSATATPSPAPTPTPTPLTTTYNPSYIYQGTETSGGGGNDNNGALLIQGPMMQSLNIQYVEAVGMPRGSTFDGNGVNACNDGVHCKAIFYNSLGNMGCGSGTEMGPQYTAWDARDVVAPGGDPDFLHDTTPANGSLYASSRDGQFNGRGNLYNTCANNTRGIWINPANPNNDITNEVTTAWFANASYINNDTHICTRWDNAYIDDSTIEYGGASFTALNNFINDLTNTYATFPFCQLFNNMAHGAGPYAWNNPGNSGSTGNIAYAANNGVVNDADDWCNNATTNFVGFQFERSITSGTTEGVGMLQNDLPYVLDTLSHIYTAPSTNPCVNVQPIFLDETSHSGDDRYFRDDELAQRLLSLRGNYTQSMSGVLEFRYLDCAGCINRVAIFPEDNLVAFPLDSGMARSAMVSTGDGNGCSVGDSGGMKSFVIACTGTDLNGKPGAIVSRAFNIYARGAYQGVAVLLVNQSNQNQIIQDNWCKIDGLTQGCSTYLNFWYYKGSGEQTCKDDQGINLGTSSATCNTPTVSTQINLAANGATGALGTLPTTDGIPGVVNPMTLGFCPGGTTVQNADCMILLMPKAL